jgi:predicted nucleic acid-binding protein
VRVLFDTNVVLDVLLARAPHAASAASLTARVERGELGGLLCATMLTTVHDLAARAVGAAAARRAVADLLRVFEVAPVTRAVLEEAVRLPLRDYEDAVLHEAARHAGAEAIVTRNASDFRGGQLTIYTPPELEAALAGRP